MNKLLLTAIVLCILIFFVYPKLVPHPEDFTAHLKSVTANIESRIYTTGEAVRSEIAKTVPLVLKEDSPVSNLTVAGVYRFTNIARNDNGKLPALALNTDLNSIADARLKDMFKEQYFEHFSPEGIGAADIAKDQGYDYILIGENIALGNFENDQALVKAWMDSPGHRANILNKQFTEIGIAVGRGIFKGKSTWIAVQVFAKPASLCPSIDKALKTKIDLYENILTNLKTDADRDAQALQTMRDDSSFNRDAYNAKVNEYNSLVAQINTTITQIKDDIATYNQEVQAFNACIKQ